MNPRIPQGMVWAATLGAGWWAASGIGNAGWNQLAALAAAALALRELWHSDSRRPGVTEAIGLAAAALGLAVGWAWPAAAALAWTTARTVPPERRLRAATLATLAIPWIATDAEAAGWFFRWTGAAATAAFFRLAGFSVTHAGTSLQVEDQPLTVDAACSGLDTLQATLVAGLWLADTLRRERSWQLALLSLPIIAWLGNTTRVIVLGAVALSAGRDAAAGWFHTWGGLAVITATFAFAGAWIAWLHRRENPPT